MHSFGVFDRIFGRWLCFMLEFPFMSKVSHHFDSFEKDTLRLRWEAVRGALFSITSNQWIESIPFLIIPIVPRKMPSPKFLVIGFHRKETLFITAPCHCRRRINRLLNDDDGAPVWIIVLNCAVEFGIVRMKSGARQPKCGKWLIVCWCCAWSRFHAYFFFFN